jgi:hypothetical protein
VSGGGLVAKALEWPDRSRACQVRDRGGLTRQAVRESRADRFHRSHPRGRSKVCDEKQDNKPSTRRPLRRLLTPTRERRIRLERPRPDTSATRASSQRIREERKTARATLISPAGSHSTSAVRHGDETPKRDRPEAGRPGQRERGQRALQGTKTSREASDHGDSPTLGTLCRRGEEAGSDRSCESESGSCP